MSHVQEMERSTGARAEKAVEAPPAVNPIASGRVLPIVTYPAAVLREVCPLVPKEDYGGGGAGGVPASASEGAEAPPPPALAPWLDELVNNMRATLAFQDGMGLAAPQVGVSARVFVMRRCRKLQRARGEPLTRRSFEVCINPRVRRAGEREDIGSEACFSLPQYDAFVRRPYTISAEWVDETGTKRRETLQGLPAVVFQHELDHLDGVLILDKEVPGIAGTPAAAEAERRFDEGLERHYPSPLHRRQGAAPSRVDDV
ncbi:hypothetical protein FNF27_07213 [Cafeteria roenbergensis]|uniref:Peptide deformylase n=1 Tax=Cafeteria roenbergensis TaxID=33653 RepID=A0A5A8DRI8_CAFRO|nr:hypothetical protein FNF29_01904 [Cafeteria roenbergensis]KAA0161809.1 hypothetical protein FNF31_03595 [Cafeteria roenbergensis]KAA0166391.1 hypothetical protein FNF28_03160 [Cafeteria roenbergensis]KAA0167965.1 hypothetical protein FNF27_07213 [Cafeteria roenbergensis]|mmetsp:Transcript_4664/g.19872  ORF Transcript_4664/g.19872 Transcript_4664/m.19872 type:complete len:258 (-) Transcript_4664:135-908(-)|eukprot:KAA0155153.1 hypothetical protein FNF29_01904 [Cafeteria roenbergensis]